MHKEALVPLSKYLSIAWGLLLKSNCFFAAVTLIGAHTIGHVHIENSGYGLINKTTLTLNAWDKTPHIFDNKYWQNLANQDWTNSRPNGPSKTLWTSLPNDTVFLNSDMVLIYNISLLGVNNTGILDQTCGPIPQRCHSPIDVSVPTTSALAMSFAHNNTLFLNAFAPAFAKLVSLGYGVPNAHAMDKDVTTGRLGSVTAIDFTTC